MVRLKKIWATLLFTNWFSYAYLYGTRCFLKPTHYSHLTLLIHMTCNKNIYIYQELIEYKELLKPTTF